MINIDIEGSEAFDRASILSIKISKAMKAGDRTKLQNQWVSLASSINEAIGYDLASKITKSPEYKELYDANLAVFEGVGEAQKDNISGWYLDKLNQARFAAKNKLQKQFFGKNTDEVKIVNKEAE